MVNSSTSEHLDGASGSSSTRDRFLQAAVDLFLREGFGPVGLDRIIDKVGVTKTTFYKYFESKDDLIVKALEFQHVQEMDGLERDTRQIAGEDPRGQILAIFDVLHEWFSQTEFRGCIFLNAATEFPMSTDPIHVAAIAHGQELARFVSLRATAAGAREDAAGMIASQVMLLISGAIISRQTARQVDVALNAKPLVEMILDNALADNGSGSGATTERQSSRKRAAGRS